MYQDRQVKSQKIQSQNSNVNLNSVSQGKAHSHEDFFSKIELPEGITELGTRAYAQVESLGSTCYRNLVSWLESSSKTAHTQLSEMMEPLRNSVNNYLRDFDLQKTQSDLYAFSEKSCNEILMSAEKAKNEITQFMHSIDAPAESHSLMGYLKSGMKMTYDTCAYCASCVHEYTSPYVNYVGESVLGRDNYNWISDRLYKSVAVINSYIQQAIKKILGDEEKEIYVVKNDAESGKNFQMDYSSLESLCKDAVSDIDHLVHTVTEYFGDKKEEFLNHRITDTYEDGIREQQPDLVRQELLGDLARKPADPFPTYEDRQKDYKEYDQKRRFEDLQLAKDGSSFVRTGIDGEMSASDKLEVHLKGKAV